MILQFAFHFSCQSSHNLNQVLVEANIPICKVSLCISLSDIGSAYLLNYQPEPLRRTPKSCDGSSAMCSTWTLKEPTHAGIH